MIAHIGHNCGCWNDAEGHDDGDLVQGHHCGKETVTDRGGECLRRMVRVVKEGGVLMFMVRSLNVSLIGHTFVATTPSIDHRLHDLCGYARARTL